MPEDFDKCVVCGRKLLDGDGRYRIGSEIVCMEHRDHLIGQHTGIRSLLKDVQRAIVRISKEQKAGNGGKKPS